MSQFVAPGAYTRVQDFSAYVPALATTTCGMVLTATKGPVNVLTLITNEGQLQETFGPYSVSHLGLYAAQAYLRQGNLLWVVRVGTYAQYVTEITVQDDAGVVDALEFSVPADIGPGSWATGWKISVADGVRAGTYTISVLDSSNRTMEVFDQIVVGTANVDNLNYVTTRINGSSNFISVSVLAETDDLEASTQTFVGGDDGSPADAGDYIGIAGTPPISSATGMQLFANCEAVDINMLVVPGQYDSSIVSAGLTLCQNRGDSMYIADLPSGMTVTQAVDWTNGDSIASGAPSAAWNTPYGCVSYNWVTIFDAFNNTEVMVPNSGHVAGVFALTDNTRGVNFAPAGERRGRMTDVLALEYSPTLGERGYMGASGNIINPIVSFPSKGIILYGQQTMYRSNSVLTDISVQRQLMVIKKLIATSTLYLVFEPNDSTTWQQYINLLNPYFRELASERAIEPDYTILCDDTTNTDARIARKELHGVVSYTPIRAAEKIITTITLTPNGAIFDI
jgi:phage tail sheath protein FI